MKKAAIYGGAFDPVTRGHEHVVNAVIKLGVVDEVWVLPTFHHFHDKQMQSFESRMTMCSYAFSKYKNVKVFDLEKMFSEQVPNYNGSTYELIKLLKTNYTHIFYTVIGQDNAETIDTWYKGNELIENEQFIVIPRLNVQQSMFVYMTPWYKVKPNIYFANYEHMNISSTEIRNALKHWNHKTGYDNLALLNTFVNPEVFEYIHLNKMYRS